MKIVHRLIYCYHYPSAKLPSARYLHPWLVYTRAPTDNVQLSNPLQCVPSITVTASNVKQGKDLRVTFRFGWGVGFMGGIWYVKWVQNYLKCYGVGRIKWVIKIMDTKSVTKLLILGFTLRIRGTLCLSAGLSARLSSSFENPELVTGDLLSFWRSSSNFQLLR
jgi:hypothetical protein